MPREETTIFPLVSPQAIELARLEHEKRFLAARIKELTG
jgi:hypothetical protein